ncbi:uncharacterized protein BCR38DRAFT_416734 [Pseudomassariella vexata]|uniref:Uncharacterized protein n=1 Tax=Pseudomassariella vexata TaxID=1141098 RepID=A0A1Y2EIM0_9PEZI|nr:uncharacterized protein BCR38DRAFT_416734 [Pseudomassariella vexata]ORY71413.1 hypothetical protein BCR38DRAFT_416734 [Pseudomassariella vexata]
MGGRHPLIFIQGVNRSRQAVIGSRFANGVITYSDKSGDHSRELSISGSLINLLDTCGRTPLRLAVIAGNTDNAQALLGHDGMDPNAGDKHFRTALS